MSRPVLYKDTFHFSVTLLARLKIRGIYSNYHRLFVVAIVQSEKAREEDNDSQIQLFETTD